MSPPRPPSVATDPSLSATPAPPSQKLASRELIDAVWGHGRVMPEADPTQWRQDACGAWMRREHFGREDSEFGWKAEEIEPGGAQTVEGLRPFHWRNRYDIANARPHCRVTADRSNVPAEKYASPPRNREC